MLVGLIRKRILDLEMKLLAKADERDPVALRLMPGQLAKLVREAFNKGNGRLPHWFGSMLLTTSTVNRWER